MPVLMSNISFDINTFTMLSFLRK